MGFKLPSPFEPINFVDPAGVGGSKTEGGPTFSMNPIQNTIETAQNVEAVAGTGYETDFNEWDPDVWKSTAAGAASGSKFGWVGAVVGGLVGTFGGLAEQKAREDAEAEQGPLDEAARANARKSITAKNAISGLQARRARMSVINRAITERASVVSQTTASGVRGSGQAGATGNITAQLQGELQYESIVQELSKRAGTFATRAKEAEDKFNRLQEEKAEIQAWTQTALQAYSTFGGAFSGDETTTEVSTQNYSSGSVTSEPSIFNS